MKPHEREGERSRAIAEIYGFESVRHRHEERRAHGDAGCMGTHAGQDSGHALAWLKVVCPRRCVLNGADKIVAGDESGPGLEQILASVRERVGHSD